MPQDMFALHAAKASSREETPVVPPPPPVSSETAAPRLPPDRQPEAKHLENQWPQLAQLPVLKAPVEEAQVATNRGANICVHIERGGGGLGLEAEVEHGTGALLIAEVREGPVLRWNQAHPEAQVRSGDIVFSVNGVIGKATELMRVLKSEDVLDIIFWRRPESEYAFPPL